jgi:hypothetical protein
MVEAMEGFDPGEDRAPSDLRAVICRKQHEIGAERLHVIRRSARAPPEFAQTAKSLRTVH